MSGRAVYRTRPRGHGLDILPSVRDDPDVTSEPDDDRSRRAPGAARDPSAVAGPDVSLADFPRAILRRLGVVVVGTALAAGIAAVACALLPPLYEAAAVLEKVERAGILESIRSVEDVRRLASEPAALESAIASAKAADTTPRELLASLATRPSSRPNCMDVAVSHRDPATAAALANAVAREAIAAIARERRAAWEVRRRVFEGRLDKLRAELVEAEVDFGRWLDESGVDAEGHELNRQEQVIRDLRRRAAVEEARTRSADRSTKYRDALVAEADERAAAFRRLNSEHDKHVFEKERRFTRYRERRDAYAGQEKAFAQYLAEAHPDEPELIVRVEASPPAAPLRASNGSIVISAAVAGLAVSAFVAMVLGLRGSRA
jgi:uncharacterized protein involved in exopolysaccharide biosynthesis